MVVDLLHRSYTHPLLSSSIISKIAAAHEPTSYAKGDFLLHAGQLANEYCILEKGIIRSFVNDFKGNDITTAFYSSEDIVIETSSLFQRIPTKENIQALTDCSCMTISFEAFQEFFHSHEGFREWGRGWISNQLFEAKERSIGMITDSASERYLALIASKPQILQQAPMKHIASFLGVTDSSLSRIRKNTSHI